MRHKDVVGLRLVRSVLGEHLLPQRAYAAAKVQDEVFRLVRDQLYATGVTAESARNIETQAGDEAVHIGTVCECPPIGGLQRGNKFVADILRGQ